ncbi:MAG: FAD-dependent oxidoreductase [Rhodospirillales bacterium]
MPGSSIIGTALGPRSPGTAYVLLHHYMGDIDDAVGAWGFARGGMGAVTRALAASLAESGGTIRTDAGAARILTSRGRAAGVALADGTEVRAGIVVSGLDVKTYVPGIGGAGRPSRGFPARGAQLQDSWLVGKTQYRAGRIAAFPCHPGGFPEYPRRPAHHRHGRNDGTRL